MGRMRLRWCVLVLVLGVAGTASAQRKRIAEYQDVVDQPDSTEASSGPKRRSRLYQFAPDDEPPPPPFPWRAVALAGLAFVLAAPFAYSSWKNTSDQLTSMQKGLAAIGRRVRKAMPAAVNDQGELASVARPARPVAPSAPDGPNEPESGLRSSGSGVRAASKSVPAVKAVGTPKPPRSS